MKRSYFFSALLFIAVSCFSQITKTTYCTYSVTTLSDLANTTSNTIISGCSFGVIGCTGYANLAAVGIVWSRDPNPDSLNYNWLHPQPNSSIVKNNEPYVIKNLDPGTTYFVRAFIFSGAVGNYEFSAGNVVSVITPNTDGTWPVTNNAILSGNQFYCIGGSAGNMVLEGSFPVVNSNGRDPQPDPSAFVYSWYSSTDGITYTEINGATAQNYSMSLPSTPSVTYYKRMVTYTSKGGGGTNISATYSSTPVSVTVRSQSTTNLTLSLYTDYSYQTHPMNYGLTSTLIPRSSDPSDNKQTSVVLNYDLITSDPWPNGYSFQYLGSSVGTPGTFSVVNSNCVNCKNAINFCELIATVNGIGCTASYTSSVIGLSMQDGSGNTYPYVQIGNQYWMTENLKTTNFNDGTPIQQTKSAGDWTTAAANGKPAYYFYTNSTAADARNRNESGLLYNGYVVFTNTNVCPTGWHVATALDWKTLSNFAGGDVVAGKALASTRYWSFPAYTNEFNFNGIPGGLIDSQGNPGSLTTHCYWWQSPNVANRAIDNTHSDLWDDTANQTMQQGFSIRCVKD